MNRKPLFDTVRRLLGRPFRQSEVDTLDDMLDISIEDRCGSDARVRIEPVPALPGSAEKNSARDSVSSVSSPHAIGPDGIALIRRFDSGYAAANMPPLPGKGRGMSPSSSMA